MKFSKFGEKFTKDSAILQLMDDLGNALNSDTPVNMLGGGNPASIAQLNTVYQETLGQIFQMVQRWIVLLIIQHRRVMSDLFRHWWHFLIAIMIGV